MQILKVLGITFIQCIKLIHKAEVMFVCLAVYHPECLTGSDRIWYYKSYTERYETNSIIRFAHLSDINLLYTKL
jgi:hypothetical protein